MSKDWLLAYDITSPSRLRQVHALVSTHGWRLQYSLYWLRTEDATLHDLLQRLQQVISPEEDDIRIYPFPRQHWAWLYGVPPWPEGMTDAFVERFAPHWHPAQ